MIEQIVIVTNATKAGAWNRILETITYVNKQIIPCTVISTKSQDEHLLQQNKVHRIIIKPRKLITPLIFFLKTIQYLNKIRQTKNNIILGSWAGNVGFAFYLYKVFYNRNLRYFVFLRGTELMRIEKTKGNSPFFFLRKIIHKKIMGLMINNSNLLITQSLIGKKQLDNSYHLKKGLNHFILPNNWNTSRNISLLNEVESGEKVVIDTSVFNVCFIGRIEYVIKGLDILLKIIDELITKNIHLQLVGDGKDFRDFAKTIKENNHINKNIHIHGELKNPLYVLKQCDVLLLTSRFEDFPNVILEAISCEVPVVATNVDGIPDIIPDKKFLFDPEDYLRPVQIISDLKEDTKFYNFAKSYIISRKEKFEFNYGLEFLDHIEKMKGLLNNSI